MKVVKALHHQDGVTFLHVNPPDHQGHAAVVQLLLAAHCNIDLQAQALTTQGLTVLQTTQRAGHAAITTMIRNTKQKDAKVFYCRLAPRR